MPNWIHKPARAPETPGLKSIPGGKGTAGSPGETCAVGPAGSTGQFGPAGAYGAPGFNRAFELLVPVFYLEQMELPSPQNLSTSLDLLQLSDLQEQMGFLI